MTSETLYNIISWSVAIFVVTLFICAIAVAIKFAISLCQWTNKQTQIIGDSVDGESRLTKLYEKSIGFLYDHYIITSFVVSLIAASIFVTLMILYEVYLTSDAKVQYITADERVVLAFVGILATFVVLTNHAQSTERIKILEKNNKKLNGIIDKQQLDYENKVNKAVQTVTTQHMRRTFDFVKACQDQDSYQLATYILGKYKITPSEKYNLTLHDNQTVTAYISISKDLIHFSNESSFDTIPNENIKTVNGYHYKYDNVKTIVLTMRQLEQEELINGK